MVRGRHEVDDDDNPVDENGVVKDGRSIKVSMMMRDSLDPLRRSVRDATLADWRKQSPSVVDDMGGTARLHQPGPIRAGPGLTADAEAAASRRAQSYAMADAWAALAWKGAPQEGDVFEVRGARMQVFRDTSGRLAVRLLDEDPKVRHAIDVTRRYMLQQETENAWRRR